MLHLFQLIWGSHRHQAPLIRVPYPMVNPVLQRLKAWRLRNKTIVQHSQKNQKCRTHCHQVALIQPPCPMVNLILRIQVQRMRNKTIILYNRTAQKCRIHLINLHDLRMNDNLAESSPLRVSNGLKMISLPFLLIFWKEGLEVFYLFGFFFSFGFGDSNGWNKIGKEQCFEWVNKTWHPLAIFRFSTYQVPWIFFIRV